MWVVKLGGSLAYSEELPRWLDALARLPIVLVPGGGPFADTVRTVQRRLGFPDRAAHAMAILAMQQYGRMLASMAAGFGRLSSGATSGNLPAIWLPDPDELNERDIPASWEVTSDSLALWLAATLGATSLLLVKGGWSGQRRPAAASGAITAAELCREGLVDGAFAGFAHRNVDCWVCGASDHGRLADALDKPAGRFTQILH
jgi:aspartokinase-like uncharacterized kinase